MGFVKYSSIENSYREKFINDVISAGLSGGRFHVSTKIHGANFSFIINKEEIRCAKRTDFIHEGEGFFNWRKVYSKFLPQLKKIQEAINETVTVTIFGELFGGVYPHKEVKQVNDVGAVQSGVYYSPDQEFLAFDIMIDGNYVSQKTFEEYCLAWDIPRVPTLFVGSFAECLAYNNEFQDPIHKLYGLPEIEKNICEGVVIKPYDDVRYLHNSGRVIIKNKNDHFSEIKGVKIQKVKPEETEDDKNKRALISSYVTDNRLKNVLSKIGTVTQKDFGVIQKAFIEDVREEFFKDYDKVEFGPIFGKFCGTECATLIRKNFQNIIDGVY